MVIYPPTPPKNTFTDSLPLSQLTDCPSPLVVETWGVIGPTIKAPSSVNEGITIVLFAVSDAVVLRTVFVSVTVGVIELNGTFQPFSIEVGIVV